MSRLYLISLLAGLPWLMPPSAAAGTSDGVLLLADLDVREVRELKDSGQIMSLEEVLRVVRKQYPGRVIEVELEKDDGGYIYDLEVVDEQGVVWDIEIDAGNGELIERERDD